MLVKSLTIAVLAFAAFAAGCAGLNSGNPRALDEVADLGPFKDHSFYEVFEEQTFAGERGVYGYPKAIVVVRKGLSKADLEKVAWAYHRSNPKARIDFFDDESKLAEYIELDKMRPNSPRNSKAVYDEGFISKHRVAQLMQTDKGDWFVRTENYTGR